MLGARVRGVWVPPAAGGAMVADGAVLEARGLAKRLGRRQVLAGVDLTVGRGEVVGICGENGSGKSTLMRVLAGLLPSDSGEVQRHDTLGYAPQVPLLYDQLSAWEHFHYFAAARGMLRQAWEEGGRPRLEVCRCAQWLVPPLVPLKW